MKEKNTEAGALERENGSAGDDGESALCLSVDTRLISFCLWKNVLFHFLVEILTDFSYKRKVLLLIVRPGFDPKPHWWETSAQATALTLSTVSGCLNLL